MSQYVSVDNQNMLWRTAHKIPQFEAHAQKETVFKQSIQFIYEKVSHLSSMTPDQLQQANRDTMSHLVQQVRVLPSTPSQTNFVVESKEEIFQRQFQERQQQYDQMNAKPNLPDASEMFKEKETDEGRIQNMDALIAEYEDQRNKDMATVMPTAVADSTTTTTTANPIEALTSALEGIHKSIGDLEKRISVMEDNFKNWSTTPRKDNTTPKETETKTEETEKQEEKTEEIEKTDDEKTEKQEEISPED